MPQREHKRNLHGWFFINSKGEVQFVHPKFLDYIAENMAEDSDNGVDRFFQNYNKTVTE